eukprot:TRINITY_DN6363_c0_g2_i2.p1 TRINITY_DN6363_c0_g2~~TRINITY_DN6363_c0_g2_i2.p1  ORF type:complete len:440 (+),score=64.60 TRINITY_DN6363_c0_g2_i2:188-1321(+)
MGYISLLALVVQNSSLVLMTRWTTAHRIVPIHTGFMIFLVELAKMVCCLLATAHELRRQDPSLTLCSLSSKIYHLLFSVDTALLTLPAGLFTLQNYLLFVSLANLDAMTFQVLSQVKLFLAAVFSVWLLNRYLTFVQWMSICMLILGIVIAGSGRAPSETGNPNNILGIVSCLTSGLSSSFAGVYFEKILKGTLPSIAIRNIQIGLPAICFSLLSLLYMEGGGIPFIHFEPFRGFDISTILLIANHAGGGILVAVVVKYADNILKGFATGVAMVVSGVYSSLFWGFLPTHSFLVGCTLVCVGTVAYHSNIDFKSGRNLARLLPGGHRIPPTPALTAQQHSPILRDSYHLDQSAHQHNQQQTHRKEPSREGSTPQLGE